MAFIKEPYGVDFVVNSKPATEKDKKMISEVIAYYKATGRKKRFINTVKTHVKKTTSKNKQAIQFPFYEGPHLCPPLVEGSPFVPIIQQASRLHQPHVFVDMFFSSSHTKSLILTHISTPKYHSLAIHIFKNNFPPQMDKKNHNNMNINKLHPLRLYPLG